MLIVLRQLHLIRMVGLKTHLIPRTEEDHNPRDVTDAKMLNPDLFRCLFVKLCPERGMAPPGSCLSCGLFLEGTCLSLPGEGMEKETGLLPHILSISSFHIAFGGQAGEVRVTQSYSFRCSLGKPSARTPPDNTPEGCERGIIES